MSPFKPIEVFPLMFSEPGNKFIPKPKECNICINNFGFNCYYWFFSYLLLALTVNAVLKTNSKMQKV